MNDEQYNNLKTILQGEDRPLELPQELHGFYKPANSGKYRVAALNCYSVGKILVPLLAYTSNICKL